MHGTGQEKDWRGHKSWRRKVCLKAIAWKAWKACYTFTFTNEAARQLFPALALWIEMNSQIHIGSYCNLVHSIRAAPRRILPWTGTRSSSDWRRPVFRMVQIWDLTWLLRVQYKERNAQIWAPESDDEQEDEEEANKIEKNSFSCLQGIHQVLLSTTFHLYHEASLIIVICTSHHISLLVLFISIYDHNFLSERLLDWACVQKRFVRFGHSAISHANQFVRIRWWMQEALETEHPVEVGNAWRPPESTLSVHTSAAPIGVVWCG